jgi:hypothetical protein
MQAKHINGPDPRLLRVTQQLDQERRARITAERRLRAVKLALRRVLAARKPADSAQPSAG